jgi:hypothetical protein
VVESVAYSVCSTLVLDLQTVGDHAVDVRRLRRGFPGKHGRAARAPPDRGSEAPWRAPPESGPMPSRKPGLRAIPYSAIQREIRLPGQVINSRFVP